MQEVSMWHYNCVVLLFVAGIHANFTIEDGPLELEYIKEGYFGSCTTSRSWDCCKPTCAWKGNIKAKIGPVKSCAADGKTVINSNIESGCKGGSAYTCTNQQSYALSHNMAYGFAAAAFKNPPEDMCCTCMLVTFGKGPWGNCAGKQMVVQITNTGGSTSTKSNMNNIELYIPGGGVGAFPEGCKRQWHAPDEGWGKQYGGVDDSTECDHLPQPLQHGCRFRWNYLNGCSNPPATYRQIVCPRFFADVSGCQMN